MIDTAWLKDSDALAQQVGGYRGFRPRPDFNWMRATPRFAEATHQFFTVHIPQSRAGCGRVLRTYVPETYRAPKRLP